MTLKSIKMARSLLLLLLTIFVAVDAAKMPMRLSADMAARPRFPRRDTPYVAYNVHKTFRARDVNALDQNAAQKLNTTLTDDSLAALNLKNFNLSESLLAQGPNPLESLDLTRANEVKKKRQQPEKSTTDTPTRISLDLGVTSDAKNVSFEIISTTNTEPRTPIVDVESPADPPSSTTSTTTTTTTTTEQSARLSALEDSFGGGGVDPVAQEPLPQPRRNGFYFLADWNSFLEVGEDPNKVVINFRPQAGDPSRFLPVSVP